MTTETSIEVDNLSKLSKEEMEALLKSLLEDNRILKGILKDNEDPRKRDRRRQYETNHSNPEKIKPVSKLTLEEQRGIPRYIDLNKYGENAMIDLDNYSIFDGDTVTEKEIDEALYTLRSMLHQIAMLTGRTLPKDKRKELTALFELLDSWETSTVPYYQSMVKALSGEDNKKKNKKPQKVGNIGVNKGMFY